MTRMTDHNDNEQGNEEARAPEATDRADRAGPAPDRSAGGTQRAPTKPGKASRASIGRAAVSAAGQGEPTAVRNLMCEEAV
jgi:hypothetical protein